MAITDAQKAQVRRHLKFDVIGLMQQSAGGGTLGNAAAGYRYFTAYGRMEWRLNNLQTSEEAILLGTAVGGISMVGPQPSVGDTVSITISGATIPTPQTLTTSPFILAGSDGRLVFCQQLAALVAGSSVLRAAGIVSMTPYGTGPFAANAVPLPEVGLGCPVPFTIATAGSGVIIPQITSQGALVPPTVTLDGGVTTLFGYLNILNGLEAAYAGASDNLDTARADVWTARGNELGLRMSLYETWVAMLSDFLGVPVNPQRRRSNDPSRHGAMRFA